MGEAQCTTESIKYCSAGRGTANHFDCLAEYRTFSGVLGHAHLRPDKSDPAPQIWTAEFLAAAGLSLT